MPDPVPSTPPPRSPASAPAQHPLPPLDSPLFSRLLTSSLGSPFLTTPDGLPLPISDKSSIFHRPSSPAPTADFSIIDVDDDYSDPNLFVPGAYPSTYHPKSLSSSMAAGFRAAYSGSTTPHYSVGAYNTGCNHNRECQPGSVSPHNPFKTLLPRLWDLVSSPARAFGLPPPSPSFSSSSSDLSPSSSPRPGLSHSYSGSSSYPRNNGANRRSPLPWSSKGKAKASNPFANNESTDYSDMSPLGGEEGELIDDEACYLAEVRVVTGIDILAMLPPELALHILYMLCPPPPPPSGSSVLGAAALPNPRQSLLLSPSSAAPASDWELDATQALNNILSCQCVSTTWRALADDNAVWRALFLARWGVDFRSVKKRVGKGLAGRKRSRMSTASSRRGSIYAPVSGAPLLLDWHSLYLQRYELDCRWAGKTRVPQSFSRFLLDTPGGRYSVNDGTNFSAVARYKARRDGTETPVVKKKQWEPVMKTISGHNDSVYCLEFDSSRIITGSRDRSIKVWSLHTGTLLGTFKGAHKGSVLCLKFERDWDKLQSEEDERTPGMNSVAEEVEDIASSNPSHSLKKKKPGQRKGLMVSGSSDCSICVWELELGGVVGSTFGEEQDREVEAEVCAKLKGHNGGVLDLKIDANWIVSCSKDALIHIWSRQTLELHRTLRGHEGPVNAIGLQNSKVVSASGDGKMILWDIESGERLRTFEGHDRGLACIEFRDDLIVSGSNDCKIKVWSATTGECLRTLVGHEALVRALSFEPRSGKLVSASYDKTVKVWDLSTGKLLREFMGTHTSHIFDVKFDVARILSTSHDQNIVILDFSVGLDASLFV